MKQKSNISFIWEEKRVCAGLNLNYDQNRV